MKSRDFTLIELLVVIGIIGLLAAMLMPALGKAREKANQADCISQMRQVGTSMKMYCNDNRGQYPCGLTSGGALEDGIHHNSPGLAHLVYGDYLRSCKIFVCRSSKNAPADKYEQLAAASDTANGGKSSTEKSSYIYYAGLSEDDLTSEHGFMRDKNTNHSMYGNVLFGDVHVEGSAGNKSTKWMERDNCFNMNICDTNYDNYIEIIDTNSLWADATGIKN